MNSPETKVSLIKRPVNLLCLSDLHLDSESGKMVLRKLIRSVKELKWEEIRWQPDFIVLAGDMVLAQNKMFYKDVKECLLELTSDKDFQLDPFRVIAVPGNHDKDIVSCWKKDCMKGSRRCAVCSELDRYKEVRDAIKAFRNDDTKFTYDLSKFKDSFQRFGEFYSPFVEKRTGGEQYIFPKEFLGENLSSVALTSGLKVFDDAKICFLCINTEWTYFPDEERKYDEGFLCDPVVFSSLNTFINEYKGYTLVTVMHHNPSEMSWEIRFRSQSRKPDILRYIYQYSDVILTGHNHPEILLPPDRMENHAQLFQLGSACMSARGGSLPQYHASLIHVDPLSGHVEICNFLYEHRKQDWIRIIDKNNYQLTPYDTVLPPGTSPALTDAIVLPIQSHRKEEIEKALRAYFPDVFEVYDCHYWNIHEKSPLADEIRMACTPGRKSAFFIYSLTDLDHQNFCELKQSLFSGKEEPETDSDAQAFTLRKALYAQELLLVEIWFRHRDTQAALGRPYCPGWE
jgi:predicted phosphodiesterase